MKKNLIARETFFRCLKSSKDVKKRKISRKKLKNIKIKMLFFGEL